MKLSRCSFGAFADTNLSALRLISFWMSAGASDSFVHGPDVRCGERCAGWRRLRLGRRVRRSAAFSLPSGFSFPVVFLFAGVLFVARPGPLRLGRLELFVNGLDDAAAKPRRVGNLGSIVLPNSIALADFFGSTPNQSCLSSSALISSLPYGADLGAVLTAQRGDILRDLARGFGVAVGHGGVKLRLQPVAACSRIIILRSMVAPTFCLTTSLAHADVCRQRQLPLRRVGLGFVVRPKAAFPGPASCRPG
jgi:hypothetical protein